MLYHFAGVIFINSLPERYDIIVSDRNQTHEGISFWQARIYDALEIGLHLYAYGMVTCELREMENETELEQGKTWLWGYLEHFQNTLAITSKQQFPLYFRAPARCSEFS